MDTRLKPKATGYPVVFTPGDYTLLQARANPEFQRELGSMLAEKLQAVLLRYHPGVDAKQLEVLRCETLAKVPKHWGILVEVLYRIKSGPSGSYRHTFHLVVDQGDLSGQFFTQTRRHIAK